MLLIDGSQGEGGGQMLRSSLALSLALERPFRMVHIRKKREKGGLRPQHLVCVRAAARIGNAHVEGAEVGSRELVFEPGPTSAGVYEFDIGTAGSTTMVLQTILLPLMLRAGASSKVRIVGGTHNPLAPSFDFIERTYLPVLAKMGGTATIRIEQHGFYPVGGGVIAATIEPSTLGHLTLLERGPIRSTAIKAGVANIPTHIAEREIHTVCEILGWAPAVGRVEQLTAKGGGNALLADVTSDAINLVFSATGERGVRAEVVASRLAGEIRRYLAHDVPVDEHLADQLMLPMALGLGGSYRTTKLSLHTTTHIDLIRQWTGLVVDTTEEKNGTVRVDVPGLGDRLFNEA
ncbi:MAG: RNA 3'-terminal phosphate cyclase [Polyangiaceae bacterium]|nr:RNA 3'-terminal phosphate cyclase [Polyangiaceae bacterium]